VLLNGEVRPQDALEAARYFRLAAQQDHPLSQLNLGLLLLRAAAAGRALPAAPGEAARFLAQAAQQTGNEESRLKALAALSEYAHEPNVVKACCIGKGKTRKLRSCSKCLTAKFSGDEFVRRMWLVHKQSCKTFTAAREKAAAAVDGCADDHGAAPGAE